MSASESRDDSFEIESNSPFYFNTSHWRAVDGMLEGVRERAGLMILTGPTGSGKTMIMRAISEGLEENTPGLFLQYASLNFREFVNFLHTSLRVEDEVMDSPNKAVALREFLYVQAKRGETGVVFIDEAHNLEPDVLKMLPKLARFDTLEDGRVVGLQFVLIGSEDLREIMADSEFDEVRAKVTVDHTLRFFTRPELKQFLKKRLAPIARMTDEPITDDGVEEMGRFTGGSPRLIGMICSHTMLFAAENPGKSIDAKMVQEAAEALMLSPVENPFADEANDLQAAAGPFSEADLSGETPRSAEKPVLPEFSDTETIYSTDAPDSPVPSGSPAQEWEGMSDTASDPAEEETPVDDGLYAPDHAAVARPLRKKMVVQDEATASDTDAEDDFAEFDHAAFDRVLDDDEDDDDLGDDEFDDLDVLDGTTGTKGKPAVRKGGASFLTKLGLKKPGGNKTAKVMGASRKKDKPVVAAAAPSKRGPKAVVAGDREKKRKMAAMAAAVVAVGGIGYAAHKPVISAVQGMMSKPAQMAAATPPLPVPQAPAMPRIAATDSLPDIPQPVTVTVENTRSPSTGGWGARVVVADEDGEPAPAAPVRTASAAGTPGTAGPALTERAIPAPAANLAKGALDLVDKALGMGERNVGNDKVGGVLAAASGQVAGLRDRLANNGLSPEEALEKARTLVAEGDEHLAGRRYITPSDGNAYDAYREALSLHPTNEQAKAGITTLREHFAKKAEGARSARQWESANGYFETAIAISNLRPVN